MDAKIRLERLISEIRRQLLPYSHEHDIERGCERWGVGSGDCLTSWIASQIENCRKKSGCAKKGLCAYYGYSDLAKKNFEICREIILLFENGDIACRFIEENEKNGH